MLSPITNTSGLSTERRLGSILIRPRLADSNTFAASPVMSALSMPAPQITVEAALRVTSSPVLVSMKSSPIPTTFVPRIVLTPIFFNRFSTLTESSAGRLGMVRSSISTIEILTSSRSISNLSHIMGRYSASSPAISTPVNPAPTM